MLVPGGSAWQSAIVQCVDKQWRVYATFEYQWLCQYLQPSPLQRISLLHPLLSLFFFLLLFISYHIVFFLNPGRAAAAAAAASAALLTTVDHFYLLLFFFSSLLFTPSFFSPCILAFSGFFSCSACSPCCFPLG